MQQETTLPWSSCLEHALGITLRSAKIMQPDAKKLDVLLSKFSAEVYGNRSLLLTTPTDISKVWASIRKETELTDFLIDLTQCFHFYLEQQSSGIKEFTRALSTSVLSVSDPREAKPTLSAIDATLLDRSVCLNTQHAESFTTMLQRNGWLSTLIACKYIDLTGLIKGAVDV